MTPADAQKLVSALDAELGRRWKKRRSTAEATWQAESENDPAIRAAQDAARRAQMAVDEAQSDVDAAEPEDAAPLEAQLAKSEAALAAAQRRFEAAKSSSEVWRSLLMLGRSIEWICDNPSPVGAMVEPATQAERDEQERAAAWCEEQGGLFAVLRQITQRAERLVSRDEAEAVGAATAHLYATAGSFAAWPSTGTGCALGEGEGRQREVCEAVEDGGMAP